MKTNKYHDSMIYMIYDLSTHKKYIGSTCLKLSKRIYQHKYDYMRYLKGKYGFCSSFDIIKNNNYIFIVLEYYKCENKNNLLFRELHYINNLSNVINKRKPINSNQRERLKLLCDCGITIQKHNLKRHQLTKKHLTYVNNNMEPVLCDS